MSSEVSAGCVQKRERKSVAIAGATGFVGEALRSALVEHFEVIGLTRSPTRAALHDETGVIWRHCDLFSIQDVTKALAGVDYALYLVHSMLPSARLTQASFVDLDLLLADNFARAAEANGLKQILYVGGIRPSGHKPSRHLRSRLEVETTLAARSTPVTAIRAGIIIGPGGSSMRMMVNLVRRLPAMVLPAWTESESAPIAIEDVVRAVQLCLGEERALDQSLDVGGPERMSYREMMVKTAEILGRRIPMLGVPVFSPTLSRRWVAAVSDSPDALVGPLIESLRHSLVPEGNWLQTELLKRATTFDDALRRSVDERGLPLTNPRRVLRQSDDARLREARTVRSVQRLPLPPEKDATWAVAEYLKWLPRFGWPLLYVEQDGEGKVHFRARLVPFSLLVLTPAPRDSTSDRRTFTISGGLLASVSPQYEGRFEFREVLEGQALIAAIHDFRPMLPWYLYNASQAIVHLFVMKSFGRYLKRLAREALEAGETPKALPPGPNQVETLGPSK